MVDKTLVPDRHVVSKQVRRKGRAYTTTEEEIRLLGPLRVIRDGGRMKKLELHIREREYTKLRDACSRLELKAREGGIKLGRELTPESLVEVLVYWYVATDGEVDLMGQLA